jgi:hypothetical protein
LVDNKWAFCYNTCIEFETQEKQMDAVDIVVVTLAVLYVISITFALLQKG